MPFTNRIIELSEDIKKQIADASFASLPDLSRAISIGAQEAWKASQAEIYKEPGANGVMDGYTPYVLQIKYPCYFLIHNLKTDDDSDWVLQASPVKEAAACMNKADNAAWNHYRDTLKNMHGATVGEDFFVFFELPNTTTIWSRYIPMTPVEWYWRPTLGGFASDNENLENYKFYIVPTLGTPKGTLLATRQLFYVTETYKAFNKTYVWGTPSADGSTCSLTVNSKDDGTGTSKTINQPYNIICP